MYKGAHLPNAMMKDNNWVCSLLSKIHHKRGKKVRKTTEKNECQREMLEIHSQNGYPLPVVLLIEGIWKIDNVLKPSENRYLFVDLLMR